MQDTDLRLAAEIGMGLLEQNEGYQADVARLERELEALRQQLAGTKTAAATQERTISELKQQVATATAAASRGEGIPPRPPHHSNIARALNPSSLSSSSPSSSSHAATTELLSPTDGSSLPHYHSALPAPAVPSLPTSKTLVDIYHKVSHRLQPPSSTSTSLTPTGLQGELVSPGSTSIDAASDVDVTIPLSPSSAYLLVVLNQVEALNTRTSQPKLPISVSFSSSSSSSALSVASAQPSHSAASSSSSSASSSSANLVPYQGVCKECHNPLLSPSPRSLPPTPHTSSSSSSSSSFSSSEDSEADNDFFDLYKAYVEALSAISILLQDKANLSSSASSPSIPPSSAAAASSSAVEIRVSAAGNGAQGLQSAPAPTPSLPLADSLALSVAAASVRRSSLADLGLNNADRSPEEQLQSLDRAYMALLQQMRALQLELDASSAAKTEADRALEVALAQVAEAEARAFACEQDAKAAREERIAAADEKGEEATARRAAEHLVDVLTLQRMEAQNTVKYVAVAMMMMMNAFCGLCLKCSCVYFCVFRCNVWICLEDIRWMNDCNVLLSLQHFQLYLFSVSLYSLIQSSGGRVNSASQGPRGREREGPRRSGQGYHSRTGARHAGLLAADVVATCAGTRDQVRKADDGG